jgi:hypothetical protein
MAADDWQESAGRAYICARSEPSGDMAIPEGPAW